MKYLLHELHRDWLNIAKAVVKKRKRKLKDLRFAKRTNNGYAFFMSKKNPWDLLEEIAGGMKTLYPHFDPAYVAELCSEFANIETEEIHP